MAEEMHERDEVTDEPEEDGLADAPLDLFAEALRERDPDLSGLEDAATRDAIDDAEGRLGIELPPLLRRFLLRWNGGSAYETCIYGVGTGDEFDIVDLNERGHEDDLPDHLVAFAATIVGDMYCFDTTREREGGEFEIVLWDSESGATIDAASSVAEWLERLPTLEHELAQAQAPEPMTVEEWEAFLRREREKLRRLAQTPARDLPMPDPDEARASLGGKIPVDPRHLKRD